VKPTIDNRRFMKAYIEKELDQEKDDEPRSDQQKGAAVPPLQKPSPAGARIIDLVDPGQIKLGNQPLFDIIRQRKSRRLFTDAFMTLEELSFLLFATQGVTRIMYDKKGTPHATLRTSPSGGARHPFETYLIINRVSGLDPGMYRYLALDHKLCFLYQDPDLSEKVSEGCCGQRFVGTGAVVFIWTAVPYRMEWRYQSLFASKIIAQDSGHLCQNLYLASEAIGCGTCAIGAYYQEKMDALVQVDGTDEFTIYVAPVGRIRQVKPVEVSLEKMRSYAGVYSPESKPDRTLTIVLENETLYVVNSDGTKLKLIPLTENEFLVEIAEDEISFESDDHGAITGFQLDQVGDLFFFRKR
jgi:SagB-type dehydrogenase family enzyme